jgi:predicted Zn-dependent protease
MMLYKAGFNPQGMVDFFQTMGSQSGSAPPEFFSSHPNPVNRQQAIANGNRRMAAGELCRQCQLAESPSACNGNESLHR